MRETGRRARAQHQPTPAEDLAGGGGDDVHGAVVLDPGDPAPEAHRVGVAPPPTGSTGCTPGAAGRSSPGCRRSTAGRFLEEAEEGVRRGGVRHGHQVGQERHLQGGILQHHPGVPLEPVAGLEEDAVEVVDRSVRQASPRLNGPSPMATKSWTLIGRLPSARGVRGRRPAQPNEVRSRPTPRICSTMPTMSPTVAFGLSRVSLRNCCGRPPWSRRPRRAAGAERGADRLVELDRVSRARPGVGAAVAEDQRGQLGAATTSMSGSSLILSCTRGEVDDGVEVLADASGPIIRSVSHSLSASKRRVVCRLLSTWLGAVRVLGVEVVGVPGDVPQRRRVADQDRAGGDRLEERLVVVDGDRVRPLDAGEQVPAPRRDEQPAAVRRVDVEPGVVGAGTASAISGSGSIAPKSVVPAVATTAIGTSPATHSAIARASATGSIRCRSSVGTLDDRVARRGRAAGRTSGREVAVGRGEDPQPGAGTPRASAWPRASSSACRLDWLPPLVNMPSARRRPSSRPGPRSSR